MVGPDLQLLERGPEVEAIGSLLTAAAEGGGAALLLQGEAGVGKTSLLQVACRQAEQVGLQVRRSCGDALERDFPWGVALQLFAPRGNVGEQPTEASLFQGQAVLAKPLLQNALVAGPAPADPFPLVHGLYWVAINLARHRPLLLVIDDLHWADAQSLRMLCYLLRRLDGSGIAVLLAARPGEPVGTEVQALLTRIAADDAVAGCMVRPLAPASIARLIRTHMPDAADAFCDALATAAGGNPFLCHEVLATVRSEGIEPDEQAADRLRSLRPAGVRQHILVRLGQLGPAAATVAAAVAVLGPAATPPVAAAMTGQDPAATAATVDRLCDAGILDGGVPLNFQHPLVREVVLDDLGPARRRHDHATAATVLHRAGATANEVATHLLQGDPVRHGWAVDALRQAASQAVRSGAPAHAAVLLRAALAANDDATQRVEILVALGRAEVASGEPTAADRFDQAMRLPAGAAHPGVAAQLGEALYAGGRYLDAAVAFDRGLELLSEPRTEEAEIIEARLLAGLDNAALMGRRRPNHLRQRMAALAEDPPAAPSQADRVLMATAAGRHALAGDIPSWKVVRLADAALAGGHLPDVLGRVILEPVTAALTFCDRFDQAITILDDVIESASARGEAAAYAGLLPVRAVCALRAGHMASAAADAADGLRLAEELPGASRQALAPARRVLVLTALARGDLAAADAAVDVADAEQQWGQSPIYGWFLDAVGRVALAQDDPRRALEAFRSAGDVFTTAGGPGTFCDWRSGMALALGRLGRLSEALRSVDEELQRATDFGAPRGIAIAMRCKALLLQGDATHAIELLQQAAVVLADSLAQPERAQVQIALGAALRRAGRRRDAREHLREGLRLARACGATAWSAHASDELAASGARRPDLAVTGVQALTPSELRVARLAAQGRTNRQIAEALFVTRKTVEVHLSSTYRKLQVSRREELSAHLSP